MPNPILSLAARTARLLPNSFKQMLYKIGPLARLLRGVLNRAAPHGLSTVTVAAGMLAGAQLQLDLQAEKDYWLGTYEPELQAAIAAFVKPGMSAYDVGANVGYISLGLGRAVGSGGQVWAFEALPANQQRLHANVALNPDLKVNVVAQAVAGQSGAVEFLVHTSGGMGKAAGSAGRAAAYTETITVPAVSLDDFVYTQGNPPPQVVKIDIEGGEVLALPGMVRVLAAARPVIFLELHGPEAAQVAWETLTAANYSLHRMEKGYPAIPSLKALDWKAYVAGLPA